MPKINWLLHLLMFYLLLCFFSYYFFSRSHFCLPFCWMPTTKDSTVNRIQNKSFEFSVFNAVIIIFSLSRITTSTIV